MKVSVCVITYNQELYIKQCLDSIISQEVSFEYEIVVSDDCSQDGTLNILREYYQLYPKIFKVLYNEQNLGVAKNYQRVLSAACGEYIALCEGDDYWTDPLKLRKQIDFLDSHQDYGFVGSYNQLLLPNDKLINDSYNYLPKPIINDDWELYGNVFEYAKDGPVTRTVSLCFRNELIRSYLHYVGVGNDMVLQTILAKHSFFAKHSASMCVYRQGGVSTDKISLKKQLYYNKWYVENRLLQKQLFPIECNYDENELKDRETYILLKNAIKHRHVFDAIQYKKRVRSAVYRKKRYCKYLLGPLTCLLLSFKLGK